MLKQRLSCSNQEYLFQLLKNTKEKEQSVMIYFC